MNIGQKIMEGIVATNLVHGVCAESKEHGCVCVWSSGAAEQIEAMAVTGFKEWLRSAVRLQEVPDNEADIRQTNISAQLAEKDVQLSRITRWRETAKEPPTAADAINEDGDEIVLAWTDPESPFTQARPYNAISWQSVIQFPNVYSFWQPITPNKR